MSITAQYSVTVKAPKLETDTMMLGYFYGNKQYILDTVVHQNEVYSFTGSDTLHDGMYFLYAPNGSFYKQFIVDKQRNFTISVDEEEDLNFAHSAQNTAFEEYIDFLNTQRSTLATYKKTHPDSLAVDKEWVAINDKVNQYQKDIMETYRDSMLSIIIGLNMNVDVPTFAKAGEKKERLKYEYFIAHYFDHIDFKDERFIYAPGFIKKIDNFLDNYIVQDPDSLIKAMDVILVKADPEEEVFKFLLVNFLNSYATSKIIGMDEIYVHLVNNYYASGMAPWVEKEQLIKMIDNARRIEPLLIGKTAPNIKMKLRDGTIKSLHDVNARYTILVFWAADCGHCQEIIPKLAEKYKKYKNKDVVIYSACTNIGEEADSCWKFVDEHPDMKAFINVYDPVLESRFKLKYDVRYTPKFFLLDRDKTIIMKRFGLSQLPGILDHFLSLGSEM